MNYLEETDDIYARGVPADFRQRQDQLRHQELELFPCERSRGVPPFLKEIMGARGEHRILPGAVYEVKSDFMIGETPTPTSRTWRFVWRRGFITTIECCLEHFWKHIAQIGKETPLEEVAIHGRIVGFAEVDIIKDLKITFPEAAEYGLPVNPDEYE
jgi:hypothetical protein